MTREPNTLMGAGRAFVEDLNAAARENPVSAALIGVGVLWMLVGRKNVSNLGAQIPAAAKSAGKAAASAAETSAQSVGAGISASLASVANVKDRVVDAIADRGHAFEASRRDGEAGSEFVLTQAGNVLSDTGQSINSVVRSTTASGREYATALQATLSDSFERQPLLLGAVGLALGAGIASSFSATTAEKELMGEAATTAKESIVGLATDTATSVSDTAQKTLQAIKAEAQRQGLTAEAATDGIKGVAAKVKNLANTADDLIKRAL